MLDERNNNQAIASDYDITHFVLRKNDDNPASFSLRFPYSCATWINTYCKTTVHHNPSFRATAS